MYSINELKELIEAVDKSTLSSFKVVAENGETVSIKREIKSAPVVVTAESAPVVSVPTAPAAPSPVADTAPQQSAEPQGTPVKAPMVGVFYAAPSPDAKPYVSVGSTVKEGDTLCIIEAMKLMNEITAEQGGTITEICVKNGDIIEYGQTLFYIK